MYSKDLQKALDVISSKFDDDRYYTKRFFRDYKFAQAESAKVGLQMTRQMYTQLSDAFKKINNMTRKPATYEEIWDGEINRNGWRSRYPTVFKVSLAGAILIGSAIIFMVAKRLSR